MKTLASTNTPAPVVAPPETYTITLQGLSPREFEALDSLLNSPMTAAAVVMLNRIRAPYQSSLTTSQREAYNNVVTTIRGIRNQMFGGDTADVNRIATGLRARVALMRSTLKDAKAETSLTVEFDSVMEPDAEVGIITIAPNTQGVATDASMRLHVVDPEQWFEVDVRVTLSATELFTLYCLCSANERIPAALLFGAGTSDMTPEQRLDANFIDMRTFMGALHETIRTNFPWVTAASINRLGQELSADLVNALKADTARHRRAARVNYAPYQYK